MLTYTEMDRLPYMEVQVPNMDTAAAELYGTHKVRTIKD
jgi:hypothetical protein